MTEEELSHPVAPQLEPVSPPVAADARIIEMLERENGFLRDQVAVKDGQIKELSERVRETNLLTAGLQKLLTPLLGRAEAPRTTHAVDEAAGQGITPLLPVLRPTMGVWSSPTVAA